MQNIFDRMAGQLKDRFQNPTDGKPYFSNQRMRREKRNNCPDYSFRSPFLKDAAQERKRSLGDASRNLTFRGFCCIWQRRRQQLQFTLFQSAVSCFMALIRSAETHQCPGPALRRLPARLAPFDPPSVNFVIQRAQSNSEFYGR
jgi:hypothetical protein